MGKRIYRFISNLLLLLSSFLVLLYYSPLKFRWPLAVLVELWPYCGVIPLLGVVLILSRADLRKHLVRVAGATLLLVLIWAPVFSWVGMPSSGQHPEGLRVMAYNIWIDNSNTDAIAQSIQDQNPDILLLSEISSSMMTEMQSRLDFPHHYRTSGSNNALFSRYPLLETSTIDFGVKTRGRTFSLVVNVQLENDVVTVIGVHPTIPIIPKFFHIRNQQLDSFAKISRELDGKVIVLGDFNATPWSPYFDRFERLSQLNNAGRGQWIWATWYFNQTLTTRYIKIPIDHIETRGFRALKTWVGKTGGSDHKPIITVLEPI